LFKRIVKYCQKHFNLFSVIGNITDGRIKPQISTKDIILSILAMMFSNLGSLNKLGSAIHLGSLNLITEAAPSITTIARVADGINLDNIREVAKYIYLKAKRSKMLSPYLGRYIGIVDGHEITSSYYPKCGHCKVRNVSKIEGVVKYQYYHSYTLFILAGEKFCYLLDLEPILPGESEISSSYRLIERVCINYPKAFELIIGDGLYLGGPTFNLAEEYGKCVIAVLREGRRKLFEEAISLSEITSPIIYSENNTRYRIWEHPIEGLWDGYGRRVRVIRSEETKRIRRHSQDKNSKSKWEYIESKADWMWVTSLPLLFDLKNIVSICHSRWQIENQGAGEIVNIWNADHIYRHSRNAILVFLLFLFIAVNITNIFFNRNIKDRKIKTKAFLIELIRASFLLPAWPYPYPPIPIPI